MKKILLSTFFIFVSYAVFSQHRRRDSNRIGINVGLNQFTLNTDNFNTKSGNGWNVGLSVRGNFHNDFDIIYSIQFSENNFSVETNNLLLAKEDVNYKLPSAQISFQLSYVLIEHHLSFEFGPLVQVSGKFNIDSSKENNIISGTTLMAKDITDISRFHFYPVVGLTTGTKHIRLNVSYQYGINNMLDNLNSNGIGGAKLKGHPGILNGHLLLYL